MRGGKRRPMTAVLSGTDTGAHRTRAKALQNVPGEASHHLISPKCLLYLILITLCCGQLYNKNAISSNGVTHA